MGLFVSKEIVMKIRSGFVSNSSSSSFIVAVKDKNNAKIRLTIEVDLSKYAHRYGGPAIISTVEQLYKLFKEDYDYDAAETDQRKNDEFWEERYKKAKAAIERGKVVLFGRFSDQEGDAVEALLCENGLKEEESSDVEIIHSERGY